MVVEQKPKGHVEHQERREGLANSHQTLPRILKCTMSRGEILKGLPWKTRLSRNWKGNSALHSGKAKAKNRKALRVRPSKWYKIHYL